MTIWFITDTHFGHKNLVTKGVRPEGFEDEILKNTRKVIRPGDTLYHMGDVTVSLGNDHHVAFVDFLKVSGVKTLLIKGNHDKHSAGYLGQYWPLVTDGVRFRKYARDWLFTHKPVPVSKDTINVHGHHHIGTHRDKEWIEFEAMGGLDGTHVLLSMELHGYRPISFDEIEKSVRNGYNKFRKTSDVFKDNLEKGIP